jgi:methylglutaconyl-CoA hydratase
MFRSIRTFTTECSIVGFKSPDCGIKVLSLNRPASKNALGLLMLKQFRESLSEIRRDPSVRCLIIKSEVPKIVNRKLTE